MAYFQQTELNVAKTEFLVIGSNQRLHSFSDDQINIEADAKLITKVKCVYVPNLHLWPQFDPLGILRHISVFKPCRLSR